MVLKRARRLCALVLPLTACAATPQPEPASPPVPTAVPPSPSSEAATEVTGPASPLSCASRLPAAPAAPETQPASASAVAGQMTEQAAAAKRLFDQERWPDAAAAMEQVASGTYGDDAGNRELAEYLRAVALFKSSRDQDAATAFLQIATRPSHLKHRETALWIVKLAEAQPVVVHGMKAYDAAAAERFNNAQQAEIYQGLLFLLGRERFERGAMAEASGFFGKVAQTSRWYQLAQACSKRAKAP